MNAKMAPVILCGGGGTRLWPRSRPANPKPFLPLLDGLTLFQQTLLRCNDTSIFAPPIIVTGNGQLAHVERQLNDASGVQILVEPEGKNTAAAIALAALQLPEDQIMLVCPSDHYIDDQSGFRAAASSAARLVSEGWLVAFGVKPTRPETGYGYLKHGRLISEEVFQVSQFVEKPDVVRAASFLREGGYSWNAGMFAFRASDYIQELGTYRPDLMELVECAVKDGHSKEHRFYPSPHSFSKIESESVDYAVMENTGRAAMVVLDLG